MSQTPPTPAPAPVPRPTSHLAEELDALYRRLHREGALATELVEQAIDALKRTDREAAHAVRARDSEVDREEVRIEEECLRLIALHQPVASDLRRLMITVKVNADIERIADHATGVCKTVTRLDDEPDPRWPVSLIEMADRVPHICHEMLRALGSQTDEIARSVIDGDDVMDRLSKSVSMEIEEEASSGALSQRAALLAYRASRELERVGDLCVSICEDVIFLNTGRIVRHAAKQGEGR